MQGLFTGIMIRNGVTSTESSLTFKTALNDSALPIFCRAISALSQLADNITAEDSIKLDIVCEWRRWINQLF